MENQQIVISKFGSANTLTLRDGALPSASAGEVVVKVLFAGVNPIDCKTRAGMGWAAAQNKDKLPWVPGYDMSGKVVACGDGVTQFSVGDKVCGMIGFPLRGGAYSQYVAVPELELSRIPDAVTYEAAAALPLAGLTAAQALNKAAVKEGERVLILAGAGGVGHLAVQIAVAAKAHVFATCSDANLDYLATLGATAINYQFAPVSERLQEVDVLIDLVGGDTALDALKCLNDNARVVTVPTLSADLICEKAAMLGFDATGMLVTGNRDQLETLLYMVSVGLLKIDVAQTLRLREAVLAHEAQETGHTRGKIILNMQC
ncbi:NADP-dependent oxidoreductase [Vibrio sp. SM6]|uniref:NADP-dependent oxidoreductase n=1 Tax=Vibrio agarilyticus TaxID=2726741 RepID=A0A7X8TQB9_9VIBR|nr:NADP-dependent oxidoreductase [Vibrio agarilyticus]NLS12814.1 NADP-dependent oxidoreductase [Vibrio agarilyticus]